jgi:hypothetical protein
MNRLVLAASACIAVLSTSAFSQGQYLKLGESAVGINASMAFADEETSFGVSPSFCYLGRVDIAAEYAHSSIEISGTPSVSFSGNNFGAGLTIHPLKQTETIPVGLAVNGLYLHSIYGGGDLDKIDADGEADAFSFGGLLHHTLPLAPNFALLIGAGYQFTHVVVDINDTRDTQNAHSYPILAEGIFSMGEKAKIVIGPSYAFNKDSNVFAIAGSLILVL